MQMNDQRSLTDQLNDLIILANRNGLYDAADYIRAQLEVPMPIGTKVVLKNSESSDVGIVVPNYKRVVKWITGSDKGQQLTYSYEDLEKVE